MTLPPRRRVTAKPNPETTESTVGEETTSLLLKMMEQVRDDMRHMQDGMQARDELSRQSRARLYERIDEVANDVGTIKGDIRILGEVDGQVRGELQALSATVAANQAEVGPSVEEFKRMKMVGLSIVGLIGIGGTAFGASLIWWGENTVNFIRWVLRIP